MWLAAGSAACLGALSTILLVPHIITTVDGLGPALTLVSAAAVPWCIYRILSHRPEAHVHVFL